MISYQFKLTETKNNKVNTDKLSIELTLTDVKVEKIYVFNNNLYIDCENSLAAEELTQLEATIVNHDGQPAEVADEGKRKERSSRFDRMVQQAKYHPGIDDIMLARYLTSIDNYINSFIRSNVHDVIVEKVMIDKDADEFKVFLNNPVNKSGALMWQYLINGLMTPLN